MLGRIDVDAADLHPGRRRRPAGERYLEARADVERLRKEWDEITNQIQSMHVELNQPKHAWRGGGSRENPRTRQRNSPHQHVDDYSNPVACQSG